MSDSRAAITHIESLLHILKILEPARIALDEHQYHPQAYGSLIVALSRPHRRAKFTWDGREFVLSMHAADFLNKNANPPWTHGADFKLPYGQGLYEKIAAQASLTLAT